MYQVLGHYLPIKSLAVLRIQLLLCKTHLYSHIYSVPNKSVPILEKPVAGSLEEPAPIYHVPDKPNPIQEVSSVPSNRISTDPGAPPIPPFCLQDPIHVPEKPVVPSNRISTDAGAPPIPPFCVVRSQQQRYHL